MGYDISTANPDSEKQNTMFCIGKVYKGCEKFNINYEMQMNVHPFANCTDHDFDSTGKQRVDFDPHFNNHFEDGILDGDWTRFRYIMVPPVREEYEIDWQELY